jgi:hypothetical protein
VLTVPAEAVKVAVVEPAVTLTDPGIVTEAMFDERVTLDPPAGAAWDRVTVQLELPPE